jgi:hypothetical protein
MIDHASFRIEKGAAGFIEVEGEPNDEVFRSTKPPRTCPNCKIHP